MKILIACEESQTICKAMRAIGNECYSADLQECSGGHPEWHIVGDCLPLLDGDCEFITQDGNTHRIEGKWDLLIAHPPCTYLTNVATRHHSLACTPLDRINARTKQRIESMAFFMKFIEADCKRIAVENPIGVMNTCYRKPDQIIHPYYFAESEEDTENYVTKATCLWLKNLPHLTYDIKLSKPDNGVLFGTYVGKDGRLKNKNWEDSRTAGNQAARAKIRSKTFPGIAKAIADQWGNAKNFKTTSPRKLW